MGCSAADFKRNAIQCVPASLTNERAKRVTHGSTAHGNVYIVPSLFCSAIVAVPNTSSNHANAKLDYSKDWKTEPKRILADYGTIVLTSLKNISLNEEIVIFYPNA